MSPGTRGDGVRLQLAGVDLVYSEIPAPELPGVIVLAAAGRNGTGRGMLALGANGFTWQAPGSGTPGAGQICAVDGNYLLEDGADASKWIRIQVIAAYLPASGSVAVQLGDVYSGGLQAGGDVAAADALAGLVSVTQYTLKNVSPSPATALVLWIDMMASGAAALSVSSDGITYYTPGSAGDVHALTWASVAPGASVSVWVKRTIGAAAAAAIDVLNVLQWQWKSLT